MPQKADTSALIAHSDSSHLRSARDLIFLPGFLASRRAMAQTATTPQTRLVALIAASGNRPWGGSSSSSGRKRGSGGGAGAAAGAGIAPLAFSADRGAAPILTTIDADDLYTVFDPDGLSQQWTVNEALPSIRGSA